MNDEILLSIELTLDETNLVLGVLGNAPYNQVATIIPKIRAQGGSQLVKLQEERPELFAQPEVAQEEAPQE